MFPSSDKVAPRPHISNPHETGPARPSGIRGGPAADQRRRFRPEGPRTAWPASWIGGFWTGPRLARSRPQRTAACPARSRPPPAGRSRASLSRAAAPVWQANRRSARRRPPSHRGRPAHPAFDPRPHLRRQGAITGDVYLCAAAHGRSHGRGPSLLTGCMESILIVLNQHTYRKNFILCNGYYISNENDTV